MNSKINMFFVAIAIAALGVAGYTLTAGQNGDSTPPMEVSAVDEAIAAEPAAGDEAAPAADDPVVAKVDGAEIRRSEVAAFMQTLPPQMRQIPPENLFPMAVEQLVSAKIVDVKASKTDVAKDPEVATRMKDAQTQIVRAVYVEKEIEKALTEDRVKEAYDKFAKEQSGVEEVKARHILVDKEDLAKEVIKKLNDGAKFDDLAKEYSKDTANKASGGDLGYFTKGDMVKEFAEAAFALKKGEVGKSPVKTQFGWHIIQVDDKRTRPVPGLDEVKPSLESQIRREILNELIEKWRKGASVETFDMNGNPVKKEEEKKDEDKK
jgi:peptidyl-prolyl cis-trans isomerase C